MIEVTKGEYIKHYYLVVVDIGDNKTLVHEGNDINKVYLRVGQMVMSTGIDKITVYRDSEEYRCYKLKQRISLLDRTPNPNLDITRKG